MSCPIFSRVMTFMSTCGVPFRGRTLKTIGEWDWKSYHVLGHGLNGCNSSSAIGLVWLDHFHPTLRSQGVEASESLNPWDGL